MKIVNYKMADEHQENINVDTLLKLLQQLQTVSKSGTESESRYAHNIQFAAFNENEETFAINKHRLENYLQMRNVIKQERKVQVLINCIGTKHYQLLCSFTAPELPNTKTYEELTEMLENHLCTRTNEITEQHKFLLRTQHEGESVATYLAELKRLSVFCNFNCTSWKKKYGRDPYTFPVYTWHK